jgi:hypothetical protein
MDTGYYHTKELTDYEGKILHFGSRIAESFEGREVADGSWRGWRSTVNFSFLESF